MEAPTIHSASRADSERVIATLVTAFSRDPIARWVFPDSHQYLTFFPQLMPHFGGAALDYGSAYCTEDFSAVSLWLPPGIHTDDESMGEVAQRAVPESDQEKVFGFLGQMDEYHPKEPHWYLPQIGVDPTQQGKGIGSALLKHALKKADEDKLPAYLEATSEDSRRLYERHGFEKIGTIQNADSPPLYPMLRRPGA